jgi:hypothetical protein
MSKIRVDKTKEYNMSTDEWATHFRQAMEYCTRHNIAMLTLWNKLKMPCCKTYSQSTTIPSTREGSMGAYVRERLKTFMTTHNLDKPLDLTVDEQMMNWFYLHFTEDRKDQLDIDCFRVYSLMESVVLIVMNQGHDKTKDNYILSLFEECKTLDTLHRPWRITEKRYL